MKVSKIAMQLITSGLFAMALGTAQAANVSTTVSYDTAGLDHTSWLVPATATSTGTNETWIDTKDLPPIPGPGYDLRHTTYMSMGAWANERSELSASVRDLRAGGIATSSANWSDSFVNNSGNSQNYKFNLSLLGMTAHMGGWTGNLARRDYQAGFVADVLVNGVSVWRSAQTFNYQAGLASVVKSGFDLGDAVIYADGDEHRPVFFALDSYAGQVDLGTFATGQSADVSYTISSFARWSDPEGCSYECGSIGVNIFDNRGAIGQRIVSAPVPEPESYAMLLGGLGLIGAIARRRMAAAK
ncbi:PEP-CTERM sorting domain-containing protein [Chitinimonas arctica]|uniref:PEP-CTERM sorting domain-containing protein n=1 Tax=Chitinimonas arctica TaxID=2594795 RepID=UPI001CC705A3|nr:PEP-CTERM sorting domain-containing protein [Chitinimonas arctica]